MRIYKPTIDYLNHQFDASVLYQCESYEVGAILHTKISRMWTNATIIGRVEEHWKILTDIGNIILLTPKDLEVMYLPVLCRRVKSTEHIDWSRVYTS